MRKLKGFTLVEILIVIVIIGILIGALVPRMQSAQGRARDVARKNDLSQLQAAIVTSFQDKGERPGLHDLATTADYGINISDIEQEILAAGMNGVPQDPLQEVTFLGIGDTDDESAPGQYRYIVIPSYGSENGGFVLMAKTEVEGGSNWVVCDEGVDVGCPSTSDSAECLEAGCMLVGDNCTKANGYITHDHDISNVKPCTTLTKVPRDNDACKIIAGGACEYANESQLRYILVN